MTLRTEATQLVRQLRRRGAVVTISGSAHYRVHNPRNGVTITISMTPSDRRWPQQIKRDIKRLAL